MFKKLTLYRNTLFWIYSIKDTLNVWHLTPIERELYGRKAMMEYISDSGLRQDGRRVQETRNIEVSLGVNSKADGSALYRIGNTKCIAAVFGPHEPTFYRDAKHDRVLLTCEFNSAPFSQSTRVKGRKMDKRSKERAELIRRTIESAMIVELHARQQIDVSIEIIQEDGGGIAAAITAASLALIDAGIPARDFMCACEVGVIEETPLLDLNYLERGAGGPVLMVASLPQSDKIVTTQMERKLDAKYLERCIELCLEGNKQIFQRLKDEVKKHTLEMYHRRDQLQNPK
eukprot:460018_1